MKIPNPNNPIFVQRNRGARDALANIAGTFNCDFSRYEGKVCPSARLVGETSQYDDTNFQGLKTIVHFDKGTVGDGPYWGVGNWDGSTGGNNMWDATHGGSYSEDSLAGSPTTWFEYSDAVVFDGGLVVSTDDDCAQLTTAWDADWFSSLSGSALDDGEAHPLEVINIGAPLLAVGDGKNMHTVTVGGTATMNRLTLDQKINMIRSGSSRAYIFTGGTGGTTCKVYEWDGGDTVPTRNYQLNSGGVLSAVVHDDVLYILTYDMEIKVLSGGGFVTVAVFPIWGDVNDIVNYDKAFDFVPVVQRGMCVLQDKILINMSNQLDTGKVGYQTSIDYLENYPAGVWEFDPATGRLSHKYAYTYTLESDGSILCYGQWAAPTEGNNQDAYRVGGILPIVSNRSALHVSGVHYKTPTATPEPIVYVDDPDKPTRARFVTNEYYSDGNQNAYNKVSLKYQPMKHEDDRIILKYRTHTKEPVLAEANWTSTTTFTTTQNLSTVEVGDEFFVIAGKSGGYSGHVTDIVLDTGTYTVTVDEPVIDTVDNVVVFQNWKKFTSFNDMKGTGQSFSVPVTNAAHIEYLVEMRANKAKNVVIEEIDISSEKNK